MARILLISDRFEFIRRITKALAVEGHIAEAVERPLAALENITARTPDLVLIDRLSDGFESFEVLLDLKSRFFLLPVLVYVLKPGDTAEQLQQTIDQFLKENRSKVLQDCVPA